MWDLIVSVPDHCLSFYSLCLTNNFLFRFCDRTVIVKKNTYANEYKELSRTCHLFI